MASSNQSPSYLEARERARKFLLKHPDGKYAVDVFRRVSPLQDMQRTLDDDDFTDWDEMVQEHRGDTVIATNNREARAAFELARQARSTMGPPAAGKAKWVHFLATPMWYVIRRQIETADPDYWNDPVNMLREALLNPDWCVVPLDVVRGELEKITPRGTKIPTAA